MKKFFKAIFELIEYAMEHAQDYESLIDSLKDMVRKAKGKNRQVEIVDRARLSELFDIWMQYNDEDSFEVVIMDTAFRVFSD